MVSVEVFGEGVQEFGFQSDSLKATPSCLSFSALVGQSQNGLAPSKVRIFFHCLYYTFRKLIDVLSKEHQCHDCTCYSRVAFSVSFNTTQTGSSASDNMNISFSCLADLTSCLIFRDDDDFEAILSEKVVSSSLVLLRMLGILIIEEQGDTNSTDVECEIRTRSAGTSATESICTTFEKPSIIALFLRISSANYQSAGSAHVKYSSKSRIS